MLMLELKLHSNPRKLADSRISNPVRKIGYLFALYSNHPFYSKYKEQLIGVLDMLEGLDYHVKKIRVYEKAACKRISDLNELRNSNEPRRLPRLSKKTNHHPAVHEAVAYIGRLGQLDNFFESDWFGEVVKKLDIALKIPSILALMPLRNKHSAHRQQDCPRKDDCTSLGFNQYGLKHGLIWQNNSPEIINIEYSFPTKQRSSLLEKYHPSPVPDIEHIGENNNLIIFIPTKIHQKIINEVIDLLELFFGFQP